MIVSFACVLAVNNPSSTIKNKIVQEIELKRIKFIGKQAGFYLYRDIQTDVEYFAFGDGYNTEKDAAMRPRYNADGAFCVYKKGDE